jgi:hypothetical protein
MPIRAFISHVTEDRNTARSLKAALKEDFHGVIEVFLSSDAESIPGGADWLAAIRQSLKNSQFVIALCSERSMKSRWIDLEAGAALMTGIDVIPVVHPDLSPEQLNEPFRFVQAFVLTAKGLEDLYYTITTRFIQWPQPPSLGEKALLLAGQRLHVRQRWRSTNVTKQTRTAPAADSEPSAYAQQKRHIVYRGRDAELHELWFEAGWNHTNLSTSAAAATNPVGNPYGYFLGAVQHVVYRDVNARVYELYPIGNDWKKTELSSVEGVSLAKSDPYAYTHFDSQHVIYLGEDDDLYELWWRGAVPTWHCTNITRQIKRRCQLEGREPCTRKPIGRPIGYAIGPKQHVIYVDAIGDVHELVWQHGRNNNEWKDTNITAEHPSWPRPSGNVAGYVHYGIQHIIYRADHNIHELWWNGQWQHTNVSEEARKTGEIIASAASEPFGYTRGITQRIVFTGRDSEVWELFWDGYWYGANLSRAAQSESGGDGNASLGAPCAYVSGDRQHVVYRDADGEVRELAFP